MCCGRRCKGVRGDLVFQGRLSLLVVCSNRLLHFRPLPPYPVYPCTRLAWPASTSLPTPPRTPCYYCGGYMQVLCPAAPAE